MLTWLYDATYVCWTSVLVKLLGKALECVRRAALGAAVEEHWESHCASVAARSEWRVYMDLSIGAEAAGFSRACEN